MEAVGTREQDQALASRWAGGRSPWDVSWGKLMMWLFLVSDAMTFAGLLIGLWAARLSSPTWPNRLEIMNIRLVALMTAILICSSTTMALSVYAMRQGSRLHVLAGVIYLWAMAVRIAKGLSSDDSLEIAGLYWGFVDLVWVFIWSSIYLL